MDHHPVAAPEITAREKILPIIISMKKLLISLFILLPALWASAQDTTQVATQSVGTGLRANGKIYVVLAVALTILTGLILYVVSLDRKISKLEKNG
jgi:hypothetical protein